MYIFPGFAALLFFRHNVQHSHSLQQQSQTFPICMPQFMRQCYFPREPCAGRPFCWFFRIARVCMRNDMHKLQINTNVQDCATCLFAVS